MKRITEILFLCIIAAFLFSCMQIGDSGVSTLNDIDILDLYSDFPLTEVTPEYDPRFQQIGLYGNSIGYPDYWHYLGGVRDGILSNPSSIQLINGNRLASVEFNGTYTTNLLTDPIAISMHSMPALALSYVSNNYPLTNEFFDGANGKYYIITKVYNVHYNWSNYNSEICRGESLVYRIADNTPVKTVTHRFAWKRLLLGFGINSRSGLVALGNKDSDLIAFISNAEYTESGLDDTFEKAGNRIVIENISNQQVVFFSTHILSPVGVISINAFTPKNKYVIYSAYYVDDRSSSGLYQSSIIYWPSDQAYGYISLFDYTHTNFEKLLNFSKAKYNGFDIPWRYLATREMYQSIAPDLKTLYIAIETNNIVIFNNNVLVNPKTLHDGRDKNEVRGIWRIDISSLNLTE